MSDDDLSKLPAAVRKQAERSEELLQQMLAPQEAGSPQEPIQETETPNEPEQRAEPETPRASEWEHKYHVLAGKYNAEVPRLNQEVQYLREQVANLQASRQEPKTGPDVWEDVSSLYDQDDPLVKLVKQQNEQIAELKNRLDQVNGHVDSVAESQAKTSQERFYQSLDAFAKNWKSLDNDRGFLDWLSQTDELTGYTRQELLNAAAGKLDAQRVAAFFNLYEGMQKKPTPVKPKPSDGLKNQVKPDAGPSEVDAGKRTYTRAEIKQFNDDVIKGRYKGREAEADAMDREIHAAMVENRIVG